MGLRPHERYKGWDLVKGVGLRIMISLVLSALEIEVGGSN